MMISADIRTSPWALALGTPVLVVAGIGHAVHISMRKRIDRARSRSRSRRRTMSVSSGLSRLEGITTRDLPMSREYVPPVCPCSDDTCS